MSSATKVGAQGYRALHYVLKIGNRKSAIDFFRDILGMKVLRHEEFEKGCEATCNGPYDGKWSKTMIGYGPEDTHFVLELTYNYGISSYRHGDSLRYIEIKKKDLTPVISYGATEQVSSTGTKYYAAQNNGYNFRILHTTGDDMISRVAIVAGCPTDAQNVDVAEAFYSGVLGMTKEGPEGYANKVFYYGIDQAHINVLTSKNNEVDHGTAFGRTAFACPTIDLPLIQKAVTEEPYAKGKILTPLISLDTPGKATVSVVIVADPYGHEICFVGDEAFRQLSQVDTKADKELDKRIAEDKSDEWFAKHGGKQEIVD